MFALYKYQQTFRICAQKTVGAVRYVSMLYGGNIIIDKLFTILKPDSKMHLYGHLMLFK